MQRGKWLLCLCPWLSSSGQFWPLQPSSLRQGRKGSKGPRGGRPGESPALGQFQGALFSNSEQVCQVSPLQGPVLVPVCSLGKWPFTFVFSITF
jgi:hypothetical protein